jgi:serine/threonine-protein kinase
MSEQVRPERTAIVGRYALHAQIASGGMAAVYFGKLLGAVGFSKPVAVKRLHPKLARDEGVRRMFIDEARLASRIAHPNVVQTLDVVEDDGELLLVLEYVHGESLQHLLQASRRREEIVPLRITLAIVTAVLHGLHAAHEATGADGSPLDIVHRDVSPQNVLVGVDGLPRVLDFGIARAAVRLASTQDGVVKGKLAYVAPEQLGGAPVDRRADVYAASVLLWEMLSGQRLFVGQDGKTNLLRSAIDPPSRHRPGVPKLLDAIALHGLARNPEQRFATAREMALALERAGEIARPLEIGEWVEDLAGDRLAERRVRLRELETASVLEPPLPSLLSLPRPPPVPTMPLPLVSSAPPLGVARSVTVHHAPPRSRVAPVVYAILGCTAAFVLMSFVLGGPGAPASVPAAAARGAPAIVVPDAGPAVAPVPVDRADASAPSP